MFLFPVCHEVPVAWLQPCCSGCTASTWSHVPGLLSRYFLIQSFVTPQSILHANACRHIIHSTRKADIANAFLTPGWGYCWHIALVSTGCTTFRRGPMLGKAGGSLHPETTFRLKQTLINVQSTLTHMWKRGSSSSHTPPYSNVCARTHLPGCKDGVSLVSIAEIFLQ